MTTGFEDISVGEAGRIDYARALAEAARHVARGDPNAAPSRILHPLLALSGPIAGQDLHYPMPALDPSLRSA